MATHSSIVAWRIPWTEEPGGLQSVELQSVGTQLKCTKGDIVQFRTSIGNLWSNPFILLVEKSSLRGKGHATQLNKAEWQ